MEKNATLGLEFAPEIKQVPFRIDMFVDNVELAKTRILESKNVIEALQMTGVMGLRYNLMKIPSGGYVFYYFENPMANTKMALFYVTEETDVVLEMDRKK